MADAYAEVSDLIGENKVPESWKEFSVYLSEKDFSIESLKMFDERSTSSGIIAAFRDSSYTNLSDYVSDMDFDCDEEYVGEGLFGHSKYKKMWYFTGFNSAAKDFIKDLTWAVNYMSTEIEEGAVNSVNSAIKAFEALIKKSFNAKIDELTKYTR